MNGNPRSAWELYLKVGGTKMDAQCGKKCGVV